MEMNYDVFKDLMSNYIATVPTAYAVIDALDFVADLLEAEADATQKNYPAAFHAIERLNMAAQEVRQLGYGASDAMAENGVAD